MVIQAVYDDSLQSRPHNVVLCTKCVNTNQRPRLTFNAEGVCDACEYFEKKNSIYWPTREKELQALLEQHRSNDGSFDVIVPTSGGKDSCYVAHQLKYEYGMHPLCVSFAPALYTDIGWKNLQSFCNLFDTQIGYPNRHIHSRLTRLGLELQGDVFQPWHFGQKAYPIHVAVENNIKLIFYGENQDLEYGGSKAIGTSKQPGISLDTHEQGIRARNVRGIETLIDEGLKNGLFDRDEVMEQSLKWYKFPDRKLVKNVDIQMHHFSYYKNWVPQDNYYYAQEHCGFEPNPKRTEGTYSKYSSLDDKLDGLHFYLQYIKFGFGRCTSEAAHEIRDGHITRDEGLLLVKKYDHEFPIEHFHSSLDYMQISEDYFWEIVDKFRSPHLWERDLDGWKLKYKIQ